MSAQYFTEEEIETAKQIVRDVWAAEARVLDIVALTLIDIPDEEYVARVAMQYLTRGRADDQRP